MENILKIVTAMNYNVLCSLAYTLIADQTNHSLPPKGLWL